jgi:hypothetical protein
MDRRLELSELNIDWILINETDQIIHDSTCRKITLSHSEKEGPRNLKGCEWNMVLRSLVYLWIYKISSLIRVRTACDVYVFIHNYLIHALIYKKELLLFEIF